MTLAKRGHQKKRWTEMSNKLSSSSVYQSLRVTQSEYTWMCFCMDTQAQAHIGLSDVHIRTHILQRRVFCGTFLYTLSSNGFVSLYTCIISVVNLGWPVCHCWCICLGLLSRICYYCRRLTHLQPWRTSCVTSTRGRMRNHFSKFVKRLNLILLIEFHFFNAVW